MLFMNWFANPWVKSSNCNKNTNAIVLNDCYEKDAYNANYNEYEIV